jgi:hypothetical protein
MSVNSNVLPPRLRDGLGDHRLASLEWLEGGRDLRLSFEPPGASGHDEPALIRVRFVWVTALRLDLDFEDYGDRPLVFEAALSQVKEGIWSVTLDFAGAPKGTISFQCNALTLEE